MSIPPQLSGLGTRIRQVLKDRGVSMHRFNVRLRRHDGSTGYRVLMGQTPDPRISTVIDIIELLRVDPDELLKMRQPPLEPPLAELLRECNRLSEEDRWLLVDLIRSLVGRCRPPSPVIE